MILIRIGNLNNYLASVGIIYSVDQLRKLEREKIVFCSYTKKGHRYFTKEQFDKSVRNVAYYFMGATIKEIKENGESLEARGKKILRVAKKLTEE